MPRRRWVRRLVIGLAVLVILAVGGPFVYIHLIEGSAAPKLSLPSSSSSGDRADVAAAAAPGSSSLEGTWKVASGSVAGYRVQEVLIGQHATAVGRTSDLSGELAISGTTVRSASFTAQMASVKSDQSERNAQFDTRIMDVSRYPTATFVLTSPISFGSVPAVGTVVHLLGKGKLTLHGVTRQATLRLEAERTSASAIEVLADTTVVFSRWGIQNPSVGGFVTTADQGTLEVLLRLTKGAASGPVTSTTTLSSGSGSSPGGPPSQVTIPATTVPPLSITRG